MCIRDRVREAEEEELECAVLGAGEMCGGDVLGELPAHELRVDNFVDDEPSDEGAYVPSCHGQQHSDESVEALGEALLGRCSTDTVPQVGREFSSAAEEQAMRRAEEMAKEALCCLEPNTAVSAAVPPTVDSYPGEVLEHVAAPAPVVNVHRRAAEDNMIRQECLRQPAFTMGAMGEEAGQKEGDEVVAFALDPEFDYDDVQLAQR
eukprot:TRINITY_DN5953_c0_g1_i1.p1 TRINITY_DN5953_c0_g1~~TRINITY_DN5953_c0_g1_i1.p1  ORF type:complete len:206 (+),score=71.12 TRINITY_DN5953_c0_g1_i1:102-719(+)